MRKLRIGKKLLRKTKIKPGYATLLEKWNGYDEELLLQVCICSSQLTNATNQNNFFSYRNDGLNE